MEFLILIIVIIGLGILIFRQFKATSKQQTYIIEMYNRWVEIYNIIMYLDRRKMFQDDDQVGVLFAAIKKLIVDYTKELKDQLLIEKQQSEK